VPPSAPDLSGCALEGRYELHAMIGEGAFGRVYRGRDRRLDRSVAVKVIKPWWAEDPEWVASFEREAQLLARVSDPGIVQIFDVGRAREGVYYVSELIDGEDLAARLRRGPLPAWEACGVAAQLCRALARAHRERIVHRDVKPANILLSTQGRVKVGDFGVARLAEGSTHGTAASIVGTPRYMAPEQGRGRPTTPATDVYSVGVVLYEMLTGRPPFAGDTAVELALCHLQDEPPPLSPRLPTSLREITERALAKEPADRYADGAEMADALSEARRRSAVGGRARVAPARSRSTAHAPTRALVGASGAVAPPRTPAPRTPAPRTPPPRTPAPRTPPPRTPPPRRPTPEAHPPLPEATRAAPVRSPRRNVNPSARRRAVAALGAVLLLLVGMVAAALVLAAPSRTRVPSLTGMRRSAVLVAARRARLTVTFSRRHANAPVGVVVAQDPATRARVNTGSRVNVVLSSGPPPVPVLTVTREQATDAVQSLRSLGLKPVVRQVAAPGVTPGTVTAQSPAGGTLPAGSSVALSVAETPQWRTVSTFSGAGSGPIHIIGERWRVVYSMGFQGTCTWIFWCSGPTARVIDAGTGQTVRGFGLANGDDETQTFDTGPGDYEIQVTPGGDTAAWSMRIEDDY